MTKESGSFLIGISGGSASGKTTFALLLKEILGDDRCNILYQDSYYFDHSRISPKETLQVNFDHPDAIEFDLMAKQLVALKNGKTVEVPVYDFKEHRRTSRVERIESRQIVVVDGILIFAIPEVRNLFDLRVFIETDEKIRFERRLTRDVRDRGRTLKGVEKQFFEQVKPMHDAYVAPSKKYAQKVYSGEVLIEPSVRNLIESIQNEFGFLRSESF